MIGNKQYTKILKAVSTQKLKKFPRFFDVSACFCNRLTDSRKLACYSGVAPFVYESGTSIRGRTGVSKFANNELKKVLHMAAISSVKHNPDLKQYFQRKVLEGKNKMSVINAVRNKLLHRVVAVIKRGTPYKIQLENS